MYLLRKAFVDALQAHLLSQGYIVSIRYSSGQDGTVTLGCDRSGHYRAGRGLTDANRYRDTDWHYELLQLEDKVTAIELHHLEESGGNAGLL